MGLASRELEKQEHMLKWLSELWAAYEALEAEASLEEEVCLEELERLIPPAAEAQDASCCCCCFLASLVSAPAPGGGTNRRHTQHTHLHAEYTHIYTHVYTQYTGPGHERCLEGRNVWLSAWCALCVFCVLYGGVYCVCARARASIHVICAHLCIGMWKQAVQRPKTLVCKQTDRSIGID